jgi:uncharacterized membrane protein
MTEPVHLDQKSNGIFRHLLVNGILKMGAPFAVVMQVVGIFILRDDNQSFREYFASSRTWITFFLHATIFGLAMGLITWFRNQKSKETLQISADE